MELEHNTNVSTIVVRLQRIGSRLQEKGDRHSVVGQGRVVEGGASPEIGPEVQVVVELFFPGHHDVQGVHFLFTSRLVNVDVLVRDVGIGAMFKQNFDDFRVAVDCNKGEKTDIMLLIRDLEVKKLRVHLLNDNYLLPHE